MAAARMGGAVPEHTVPWVKLPSNLGQRRDRRAQITAQSRNYCLIVLYPSLEAFIQQFQRALQP